MLMFGKTQDIDQLIHVERIFCKVLTYLDILSDSKIRHKIVELENESEICTSVIRQFLSL